MLLAVLRPDPADVVKPGSDDDPADDGKVRLHVCVGCVAVGLGHRSNATLSCYVWHSIYTLVKQLRSHSTFRLTCQERPTMKIGLGQRPVLWQTHQQAYVCGSPRPSILEQSHPPVLLSSSRVSKEQIQ